MIKKDESGGNVTMSLVCLDPSIAIKNIMEKAPYNIILTSGTIYPF